MLNFLKQQLYLANAADYRGKQEFFYPLKHKLLQEKAKYEGWENQKIIKVCWCSDYHDDGCNRCNFTGIYSERTYYLQRWNLDDHIYHVPVNEKPEGEALNQIQGKITHCHVSKEEGRQALIWLMLRYQPFLLLKLWLGLKQREFVYYLKVAWWDKNYIYTSYLMFPDWFIQFNLDKILIAFAVLFTGYYPLNFRKDGFYIGKPKRNDKAFQHFLWMLQPWIKKDKRIIDEMPF
jgi:hypothetical protein